MVEREEARTESKREYPSKLLGASVIGEEERMELEDVIREKSLFRHYGIGKPCKVNSVELELASYLGVKYALCVSSGSAALLCALAALGLKPGDEVILPAFSWYADYNAIVNLGAVPVFAEIDETMCLDAEDFERKITGKTKAAIIIHYQGATGNLARIAAAARANGIALVEDAAQAFGGEYNGGKFCSFGDISITSFQNNKVLTCGEGGLVCTNDERYYERAVRYHDLGFVRDVFAARFTNAELAENSERCFAGLQFRMNEMQGAVLKAQFRKLPYILGRCRSVYARIAGKLELGPSVRLRPLHDGHCGIALFMRFADAETAVAVSRELSAAGVPVGPASSCCNILHNPHVRNGSLVNGSAAGASESACPNTDAILARYVGIGIGPLYTERDADDIAEAANRAVRRCAG